LFTAQLLQLCKSSGSDSEQVRGQIAVSLMSRDAIRSCPVVLDEGGNFNQTREQNPIQGPRKRGASKRPSQSLIPEDFGTFSISN